MYSLLLSELTKTVLSSNCSSRHSKAQNIMCQNLLDSLTPSPARKAFEIVGRDNTCEHPVEDVLFPTSNQMKSSLKRRNRVIDFEDRQHRNEVAPELRSPKLLKVGCKDVEMRGYTSENFGERSVEASKHWTDVCKLFWHYFPSYLTSLQHIIAYIVHRRYIQNFHMMQNDCSRFPRISLIFQW